MDFRTPIDISPSAWKIEPCERMLFVGSCFADNMGRRFCQERFRAVVNPHGVMYNPASIVHTVERLTSEGGMPFQANEQGTCVFTLGTNHVYVLKETGEIVDNCQKRPQRLFDERVLSVEQCADYISQAIAAVHERYPQVRFVLTVSPIRYRKYGYHGSQLSKATLLLAIEQVRQTVTDVTIGYFPSYEIVLDELRDYRFYQEDMLHPTPQAIDYIFERFGDTYFSRQTQAFIEAWRPIREALGHRPFHPESEEYARFMQKTMEKARTLQARFPQMGNMDEIIPPSGAQPQRAGWPR
ncbi:MAG TPA: GSCFA family protein [Prevotella sp.]|nr:GSCFA family protein [Prevotella sp.]